VGIDGLRETLETAKAEGLTWGYPFEVLMGAMQPLRVEMWPLWGLHLHFRCRALQLRKYEHSGRAVIQWMVSEADVGCLISPRQDEELEVKCRTCWPFRDQSDCRGNVVCSVCSGVFMRGCGNRVLMEIRTGDGGRQSFNGTRYSPQICTAPGFHALALNAASSNGDYGCGKARRGPFKGGALLSGVYTCAS
jgi:hypothetical protein